LWALKVHQRSEGQSNTEIFIDRTVGQERVGSAKAAGVMVSESFGSDDQGKSTILYVVENGYVTRVFGFGDRSQTRFQEDAFLPQVLKPELTWSNSD
jgi:hypothetical protein